MTTNLTAGPYVAPEVKPGDALYCEFAAEDLIVGGMTDAQIPWPRRRKAGRPSLILTGDLVRAVQTESEIAIAHHWGVGVTTIWKWRQALGIGRVNEGTAQLYRDLAPAKLGAEVAARGRAKAAEPEAIERMRATKIGQPAHPNTRASLLAAAKGPRHRQWRDGIGLANRHRRGPISVPISLTDLASSMARLRELSQDMTISQIIVLAHCAAEPGGQTYKAISRHAGLDLPLIGRAASELVAQGMIARRGASGDARFVILRATERGRRIARALAESIQVRLR